MVNGWLDHTQISTDHMEDAGMDIWGLDDKNDELFTVVWRNPFLLQNWTVYVAWRLLGRST